MPVFDYGRYIYGGIKLTVFVSIASYLYPALSDYTTIINVFVDGALSQISSLTALDLGCFMEGLGGRAFLNSIINQMYIIGTLVVSAVGTILTTKFTMQLFGFFMRI